MANYNPATGGLNPNMITNLSGGNMASQISRAAGMGAAGIVGFQAHQEDLISSMSAGQMQMFDISLMAGGARLISNSTGANMEDSFRFYAQNQGKSKPEIDAMLATVRQNPETMRQNGGAALDSMRMQAGMEDFRNRFNIGKRISNAVRGAIVAPVANAFTGMATSIGESVENIGLRLTGAALVDPTLMSKGLVSTGERLIRGGERAPWALSTSQAPCTKIWLAVKMAIR